MAPAAYKIFFLSNSGNISGVVLSGSNNQLPAMNYFMVSWSPDYDYIKKHLLSRYIIDGVEETGHGKVLKVTERKAAFLVRIGEIEPYLCTETGDVLWYLKKNEEVYYSDLPTIFGEKQGDLEEIIRIFSSTPLKFRNFVSSIDIDSMKVYFRNGNMLITHSWDYLKIMDWNSFIADLKMKTVYELYSNGKYFPISRER